MNLLKRIILPCIFLLIFSAGCSNTAAEPEKNPLDGVYYCQRVTVFDAGGNKLHFYNAADLGAENTSLSVTNGKDAEFTWYYHGEANDPLYGSVRNITAENDIYTGDVTFEGVSDKYTLSYKMEEDGTVGSMSFVYPFGENGNSLGLSLSSSRQESKDGPYAELSDAESKLKDFLQSDVYANIEQVVNRYYSEMNHDLRFDPDQNALVLSANIDDVSSSLGKSEELDQTWDKLCSSFDSNASSIQTVINTGGYRGIHFVLEVSDGSTLLYRSENGERVFTYKPESTAAGFAPESSYSAKDKPSSSGSGTAGSSFEQSEVYKTIRKTMKSSFPDRNPEVKYSEKDHMLTVTLTGGKGWETAVLNDRSSYANWLDFTNGLLGVSESGYEMLCDAGYSDIAFSILVLSHDDSSKALFGCMNGVSYYDFTVD